jgi:hypothetical protein
MIEPMTPALAGRMTVWTILILVAYFLLGWGIGTFLGWVRSFYPVVDQDERDS